jgi:hypothetical protein
MALAWCCRPGQSIATTGAPKNRIIEPDQRDLLCPALCEKIFYFSELKINPISIPIPSH